MLSSELGCIYIIVVKDILLYRDQFSINLYIYYYNRLNQVTQQNCVQKSLNCVACTVYTHKRAQSIVTIQKQNECIYVTYEHHL